MSGTSHAASKRSCWRRGHRDVVAHQLLETVGRFDTSLRHGDITDWFLRAAEGGAVTEVLPDVLVYRGLHQTSPSRVQAAESRTEFPRIAKSSPDRRRERERGRPATAGLLPRAEATGGQRV